MDDDEDKPNDAIGVTVNRILTTEEVESIIDANISESTDVNTATNDPTTPKLASNLMQMISDEVKIEEDVAKMINEAVEFSCDLCDLKTVRKKHLNKYIKKHNIIEQVDGINDKESDMEPISDTLESNEVNMAKKDSTTPTPVPPQ